MTQQFHSNILKKKLKLDAQAKTHKHMFAAALLRIAKRQKQLKCLSANEWVNKMWHDYAMEYYSGKKY